MRVLVLYAHPGQRHSVINQQLARTAAAIEGVTFVDLYAEYPRFHIHVEREQTRLKEHDAIVLQFPFYWYATPALLKEWQDLVLEYDFAYGPKGTALAGKLLLPAVTAGGPQEAYLPGGRNQFTVRQLLLPLEQTAMLCSMRYIPPFVLHGAHRAREDGRGEAHRLQYHNLLEALLEDRLDLDAAASREHLGEAPLPISERG